MRPILFTLSIPFLGSIDFPAYMTFLVIGLLWATAFLVWTAPQIGFSTKQLISLLFLLVWGGLIGSRLLHVIADGYFLDYWNLCFHPEKVKVSYTLVSHCYSNQECGFSYICNLSSHSCQLEKNCLAWIEFWRPGLAYYGGFLLATIFSYFFSLRNKVSFLKVVDFTAPAIALGLAFGRIGCFLHGCCFGKRTFLPWGIRFPMGSDVWRSQRDLGMILAYQKPFPVHPTQLYEAVGCLFIFFFLYFRFHSQRRNPGQVLGAFLVLYGILRSCCEIFRDDMRGLFWFGISTSQIISVPLVIIGMWLWMRKEKNSL